MINKFKMKYLKIVYKMILVFLLILIIEFIWVEFKMKFIYIIDNFKRKNDILYWSVWKNNEKNSFGIFFSLKKSLNVFYGFFAKK